jgi:hypothetical protein
MTRDSHGMDRHFRLSVVMTVNFYEVVMRDDACSIKIMLSTENLSFESYLALSWKKTASIG